MIKDIFWAFPTNQQPISGKEMVTYHNRHVLFE